MTSSPLSSSLHPTPDRAVGPRRLRALSLLLVSSLALVGCLGSDPSRGDGADEEPPCAADVLCRGASVAWEEQTANVMPLFSDTATYLEIQSYEVNTQRLVECEIDGDALVLTNWLPADLTPFVVVGIHEGRRFELFELDRLGGISEIRLDLSWVDALSVADDVDGGDPIDLSTIDFQSGDVSCGYIPQTVRQEEIQNHPVNWTVRFPDRVMSGSADVCRDGSSVVWRHTRPQFARYIWTFMITASQVIALPRFREMWMSTPFRDFEADIDPEHRLGTEELATYPESERSLYDAEALARGEYYNRAHREMVYERYFNKTWSLGSTGGGGLGGGATLGLNHTKVFEKIFGVVPEAVEAFEAGALTFENFGSLTHSTPWNIMGHEAGHAIGFGHHSTYCVKSEYGHIVLGTIGQSWLLASGGAWITPENMIGRDESWEQPYEKKDDAPERSRPRCGDAYEWGGPYGRHDLQMPPSGTLEFETYIQHHLAGTGLEYLEMLQVSPATYYSWWTP